MLRTGTMTPFGLLLLLAQVAATLFMTGLIWFVQVVHYPLMAKVGLDGSALYARQHAALTTWVVGPVMLLEAISALALLVLWKQQGHIPLYYWLTLGFLGLIWVSTALLSVPQHRKLALAFDAEAHAFLVNSNWLRTILWTLRGLFLLWMLWSCVAPLLTQAMRMALPADAASAESNTNWRYESYSGNEQSGIDG